MEVIFYKAKYGTWVDKLIAWWTGGEYSHCLVVVNRIPYEVSPENLKVERYGTCYFYQNKEDYDFYRVKIDTDEVKVAALLDLELGKKYDWLGIWLSQFLPFRKQKRNKWFCSELTAYALKLAGVRLLKQPQCYSPNHLYRELKRKGLLESLW